MFSIRMSKVIVAITLILMLAPLAVFAGGEKEEPAVSAPGTEQEATVTTEAAEPETITITDGFGREVTIKKPVKKVAIGHFVVSEMIKLLGAEDRIVAVDLRTTTDTLLYPEISQLPVIQTADMHYEGINYEKIFELRPDIFVTAAFAGQGFEDITARLEPEIPVLALGVNDMKSILDSVKLLAVILGEEEKAGEYLAFCDASMGTIANKVAEVPEKDKPRVYFEFIPYMTFNDDCPVFADLIAQAGGINIAADMSQQWGMVDPEWVMMRDPDIIVSEAQPYPMMGTPGVACGYDVDDPAGMEAHRNASMARSELAELKAVKTGKVYGFFYGLAVGGKLLVGTAYLAKWSHPNPFADLDPQAIHQEYLTKFMRIDYDLSQHGVFVYPEP